MTSNEFVIWLRGFTTACNDYAPTPKQWDIIKETLDKVDNNTTPMVDIVSNNTFEMPLNYIFKNRQNG